MVVVFVGPTGMAGGSAGVSEMRIARTGASSTNGFPFRRCGQMITHTLPGVRLGCQNRAARQVRVPKARGAIRTGTLW